MQNTTSSTSSSEPSTVRTRTEDSATKATDRLQSAAGSAASIATETANKVRDQVQATADKLGAGKVEEGVRGAVETAKDTLLHATEEGSRLLHEGRDAAIDTYQSARDYAIDTAYEVSDRARRAGYRTASYARRASEGTGRFVALHALPLTVVGAGLGWLAWSMRREALRRADRENVPARLSSSTQPQPTYRADYERGAQTRGNTLSGANPQYQGRAPYGEQDDPRLAGMPTSGNKLMGVRTGRLYEE